MSKFPISKWGFEKLNAELHHLKTVQRPKIIEEITTARAFGDLSENAEYDEARKKQSFTEGKIVELEDKLARAEIIDISKLSNDTIKFGALVELIDDDSNEKVTYHVVGEYEADLNKRRISVASPLAKALIGKKIGDIVEVNTPKGYKSYEVTKITHVEID